MYFPMLLVLTACAAVIYRAFNPHIHKIPKFAARARMGVGFVIVALLAVASYRMPNELSDAIQNAQERQNQQQIDKKTTLQVSELRHVTAMISALGGIDNYLAYLDRTQSVK